ncbi:hypothetical protein KIH41_11845 [Litoribacter ruber]|uniref:hypothetical protein n=1 Tax=Litoribacter ruber TaxID=702568 RepID=UPI001BD9EB31|nr:hypothetical protein [Litoribacter ruber]MBT0811972.1 hypothetical protein [Litoribacter ruber]
MFESLGKKEMGEIISRFGNVTGKKQIERELSICGFKKRNINRTFAGLIILKPSGSITRLIKN